MANLPLFDPIVIREQVIDNLFSSELLKFLRKLQFLNWQWDNGIRQTLPGSGHIRKLASAKTRF
jgi:hypothetical protein